MADRVPFRDVVQDAIGGGWGQELPFEGSIPVAVIRGTDFDRARSTGYAAIPRRHEDRRKALRRLLRPRDVILEVSGGSPTSAQTTGRSLFVTDQIVEGMGCSVIPASFCRLVRFREEIVDPRYAFYSLQDMYLSGRAGDYEHQSTGISNFQFEFFLDVETIRLPPLPEQRAVAHILGDLDDKIELNRRMSETLEAIARALFTSWFVDFDPVRAKSEGHDPGLPPHLADLFPDSFEDSELGEIPRGWRIGRFGEVADQLRDQENPLSSPLALFHHFSLPAFDDGQRPRREFGEGIKSLKSRVPTGVILLSKLNPEIERVWMVDVRPGERAVCSTEFLVLCALSPFTRGYVYCLARSPLFRQQIESLVTGTSKSHQRAQVESILSLPVVAPPSSVIAAFDSFADRLLARTLGCRRESDALAALRDTLLPKLISGELRVADAERVIGARL